MRAFACFISALLSLIMVNETLPAAEGPAAPPQRAEGEPGPTVVEVPVVVLPVSADDGRLLYYAYLMVQLEIPNANDRWSVEEKIPQIKDSFVRELHSQTNRLTEDPDSIDVEGVRQRLAARVQDIVPYDTVGALIIKDLAVPKRR